jgi:hypothetical protein
MFNLTNYWDHPADNRYTVFRFFDEEHADHFESLLKADGIEYERHLDDEGEQAKYLFGISKQYQKRAIKANFLTHGVYRKPFIGNAWFKYTLLLITAMMILIAIVGYLKNA